MTAESRSGCHVLKCRLDSGPCCCALIWSLTFTLNGYGRGSWRISFTIESGALHQNMSMSSSFDWPILRSVLEGTNRKHIASCPRTLLLHSFCLWPSGPHAPRRNTNQIRVLLNSARPLGENAALHSVLLTTVNPQYLRMPSQTHNERKTQHLGAPCRKWGNIYISIFLDAVTHGKTTVYPFWISNFKKKRKNMCFSFTCGNKSERAAVCVIHHIAQ